MPRGYLDKAGGYYESDGNFGDTPVPNRPSVDHAWNGSAWESSPTLRADRLAAEREAEMADLDRPALRRMLRVLARRFGVTVQELRSEVRAEP